MRKLCGVLGAFVMIATMLTITGASAQDDEGGERVGDPDRVVEQPVSDPTVYPPPANGPAGPGSVSSAASGTSSTGVISVFFGPAPASVTLPVDAFGTINDVNARVRINHTWANDAVLTLKHPSGTSTDIKSSDLTDAVGLDDFGTGPACSGTFTTFDDEAATPIGAANPPFAGSFKPSNPLSVFDGKEAAGVWELTLGDDFPAVDDGTLLCFELVIDYTETFPTDFRNGSFEDGKHFAGWGVSDISPAFIPIGVRDPGFSPGFGLFPTAPTDGVQSASHGFDGMGPGNIDLYQDLKLPPGALLTFDWGAEWDYSFGTPTKDRSFDVIVAPAGGGTPLATIPIFETDFAGNGVSLASASVDDELEVNIETSRRGSISTSAVVGTGFFTTSIDLSNMPSANVRIRFRAT
ncbi:MAG: proprotein convertase P-domain-containing protein, partial [Acidimicrobiia bacterium]|nr:proprotein convertase P-domain-containing protein [Acidimicrobiia bacterium]